MEDAKLEEKLFLKEFTKKSAFDRINKLERLESRVGLKDQRWPSNNGFVV